MTPVSPRSAALSANPMPMPGNPATNDAIGGGKTSASFEDLLGGNAPAPGKDKGKDAPADAASMEAKGKDDPAKDAASSAPLAAMAYLPWMAQTTPPPSDTPASLAAPAAQESTTGDGSAASDAPMTPVGAASLMRGGASPQPVALAADGGSIPLAASAWNLQTLTQITGAPLRQTPPAVGVVNPLPVPTPIADSAQATALLASLPGGREPSPSPTATPNPANPATSPFTPMTAEILSPAAPGALPPKLPPVILPPADAAASPTGDGAGPTAAATPFVSAGAPTVDSAFPPEVAVPMSLPAVGAGRNILPQPVPGATIRQSAPPAHGANLAPSVSAASMASVASSPAKQDDVPGFAPSSAAPPPAPTQNDLAASTAQTVAFDPGAALTGVSPGAPETASPTLAMTSSPARANFAPAASGLSAASSPVVSSIQQPLESKPDTIRNPFAGTTTAKSTVAMTAASPSVQSAARNGAARFGGEADENSARDRSASGQGAPGEAAFSQLSGTLPAASHNNLSAADASFPPTTFSGAASRADDAAALLQRATEAAERLRANGGGHIEVQAPLGGRENVTIQLRWENGSLHATFRTDSPELRQALERDWGQFTAHCAQERGLPLSQTVRFEPSNANGGNSLSFSSDQNNSGSRQSSRTPRDEETASLTTGSNPSTAASRSSTAANSSSPASPDRWNAWA